MRGGSMRILVILKGFVVFLTGIFILGFWILVHYAIIITEPDWWLKFLFAYIPPFCFITIWPWLGGIWATLEGIECIMAGIRGENYEIS